MNIPQLRFPEFNEDWEKHNLGEIATFSKGKGISKADIVEDGTTECIRYGELYTTYGETIDVVKSKTNINAANLVFSEANDVIIPASGETQIDIATASCVLRNGIAMGGDLNIIKTQNNGVFLSYYLNNKKKQEIASLAQGIAVVHLYSSQLSLLKLNLPSRTEQDKIALFIRSTDEKIQALKKKHSLLEQYKKGLMQKLFSQELRFKDENGKDFPEWEEKKLNEVLTIQGGFAFKSKLFKNGKTKVFRIGDIDSHISIQNFTGVFSSEIPNEKYLVKKNDFLMALSGATFGKVGKIIDDGIGFINQRVATFRTNKCLEFYYQMVQTNGFKTYINSIPSVGAQPNISNNDISNYLTLIPCFQEQIKIAEFLSGIDEKRYKLNLQIQSLENWKKGLMQKMFC